MLVSDDTCESSRVALAAIVGAGLLGVAAVVIIGSYRSCRRSAAGPTRRIIVERSTITAGLASPDAGTQVVVGTGSVSEGRVWLVDVVSGRKTELAGFPTAGIACLDWSSPDGHVAVGRYDGVVSVIGMRTGNVRDIYSCDDPITAIATSKDGHVLAAGTIGGDFILYSTLDEREPTVRMLPNRVVADVAVSNDGSLAASCDVCGVLLWRTQDESRPVPIGWGVPVERVEFSPDGQSLFYACEGETIHEWDIAEGRERRTVTIPATGIVDFALSPDAHFLVSSSTDRIVRLWDWRSGRTLAQTEEMAQGLCIIDSGRYAVIDLRFGSLLVWDLDRAREDSIPSHADAVAPQDE